MINYNMQKNEGDISFQSKEQAVLELIVVSNAVLEMLSTDGVSNDELKELYTGVCSKYGVWLDCRLLNIVNGMEVDAMDKLVRMVEERK
uniref:hypothetical protein n=1 Tax=Acetatifactor sp. TaxID=1872090 RepID=UPI0040561D6D